MKFKLSKYILPAVISMVLVGAYTNIDGLFIGKAAGDDGIAAINIVWPIVALITSLGTGIGVGGSVVVGNLRGKGETEGAAAARRTSLFLLIFAGLAATLVLFFCYSPLLRRMGAEGQVLAYAENYAFVVTLGAVFQVMGAGLVVLLRCDGKTGTAMLYTAVGLVIHVLLDWLLVDRFALYGVAVSTVAAQAAVMTAGLFSYRIKWSQWFHFTCGWEIIRSSFAPFGVNFVSSLVLLFTNYFALQAGGTAAVSAYGVMSYAVYTYDYVFQGVCDGVQPVISFCNGAGDDEQKRKTVRISVALLAVLAGLFALLTPVMIRCLPALFFVSAQAEEFMQQGLIIYAFSYPFKAGVKFICAYHYSNKRTWQANILIYLDPLLFTPLLLRFLPSLFGMNGIWLALPVTQIFVFVTGVFLTTVLPGIGGNHTREIRADRKICKTVRRTSAKNRGSDDKEEGQVND